MEQFTKRDRKELRSLAGIAYERELGRELEKLEPKFAEWRAGRCSPFDVSDSIHEFHDHAARQLWKIYTYSHPEITVPRAVALGVLADAEISPTVYAKVRDRVGFYRDEAMQLQEESENPVG